MSNVELRNVSKSFGALSILQEINVSIKAGEFCVLVGPSGCGKSTLLRTIAGLEEATGGSIQIGTQDVTHLDAARRGVAMVFQSYALYPHMSVYENLGFSLRIAKIDKADADLRIRSVAKILRLEPYLARRPKQLSGGQRQRVAIGRAMVRSPDVFLFDEPLSNLDAELRGDMRIEIAKLHRELGSTMIYVTHDQVEAMTLADRIVVLRAGRVEQIGSPMELYRNPANRFVASFIGLPPMNFFKATSTPAGIVCPGLGNVTFNIRPESVPNSRAVIVGLRPEHLVLDPARTDMIVDLTEQLGGMTYVHLQTTTNERLVVAHMNGEPPQAGARISVRVKSDSVFFFDPETDGRIDG